jgi:hypothetical protein
MNERVDQKNIYMLLSALKELKRLDIFIPPWAHSGATTLLMEIKPFVHRLITVPPYP